MSKFINGVTYCDIYGKPILGSCELDGKDLCISCSIQRDMDKKEYDFNDFRY